MCPDAAYKAYLPRKAVARSRVINKIFQLEDDEYMAIVVIDEGLAEVNFKKGELTVNISPENRGAVQGMYALGVQGIFVEIQGDLYMLPVDSAYNNSKFHELLRG